MKETIEKKSLLHSYFTILGVFADDTQATQDQLNSIYQWGQQLGIPSAELDNIIRAPQQFAKQLPENRQTAAVQLYNLVYMIYLDNVVDDCEIEILMNYAEYLGFPQHIVGDIIKAILTAPSDGIPASQVKNELKILLESSLG